MDGRQIRKGAADAIERLRGQAGGTLPAEVRTRGRHDREGAATPLVVAEGKVVSA